MFSGFGGTFNELYDKYFPIMSKTLNNKDIKSPWINDYLKDKMKTRDKLFKLA